MKRIILILLAASFAFVACRDEIVEDATQVNGVVMDCSAASVVLITTDNDHNKLDTLVLSISNPVYPDSLENCAVNDYVTVKYSQDELFAGTVLSLKVRSHLVSVFVSEVRENCVLGNSDDEGLLRIIANPDSSAFFDGVAVGDELFLSCKVKEGIADSDTLEYEAIKIVKEY